MSNPEELGFELRDIAQMINVHFGGRLLSIADRVDGLAERVEELERELRHELWLNHGHQMLYGDDGEMWCGTVDFKRQPLEELRVHAEHARLERAAKSMSKIDAETQVKRLRDIAEYVLSDKIYYDGIERARVMARGALAVNPPAERSRQP